MNPRKIFQSAAIAALAFLAGACAKPAIHVTVFHTNDIHGWIMERPAGRFDPDQPQRPLGGFAALASVVRAHVGPKLLLDAGDWFQGTPEGGLTKGVATIELLNALGYDAAEIGNHDWDDGQANLAALAARAKFPVLGANIYDEKTGRHVPYVTPRFIKTVAGVRFGIFGLLTTDMPKLTFAKNYKGVRFRDESEEARDQVAALKQEGAEVIIAVTHVGFHKAGEPPFEDDQAIAAAVPGIDLIVGGHSHTPLQTPVREPKSGTWIVQAGSYLQYVGDVDLSLDPDTHKIVNVWGRLIPLWPDRVGEDPDIAAQVKRYQDEVGKQLDAVIGKAGAAMDRAMDKESALGDWMADCMRGWAHADAAFQNAGGIRNDIPAGPVTLREIYDVMPFDNTMVVLRMKGRDIEDVLENGVSGGHGMIQVSGVRFRFDPKAPAGRKVLSTDIGGAPLDPDGLYTVATSDFMDSGGDGYTGFARAVSTEKKDMLLRDVLGACARRAELEPPAPDRATARE